METCLTALSTELLISIASHLSQLDLLNVALVCKRLQAATESELYREYHPLCLHRRTVTSFIKALLNKPRRIAHVKSLELPEWESLEPPMPFRDQQVTPGMMGSSQDKLIYSSEIWEYDPARFSGNDPSREDYNLFTNAAREAGLIDEAYPYAEQPLLYRQWIRKSQFLPKDFPWLRNQSSYPFLDLRYNSTRRLEDMPFALRFCTMLRAGVDEAYVVLLVGLLKKLCRLVLNAVPWRWEGSLPWTPAVCQLPVLREFTAAPNSRWFPTDVARFPLGFFANLVWAPKLERCTLDRCSGVIDLNSPTGLASTETFPIALHPRMPLVVTTLVLSNTLLVYSDLKLLLASCRLKIFHYSHFRCEVGTVTAEQIVQLLEPCQNSLERLYLFIGPVDRDSRTRTFYERFNKPFSSLINFTRLEALYFPTHMLESAQKVLEAKKPNGINFSGRLPPNLREVNLYDTHWRTVITKATLSSLVEVARTELASLQTLTVEGAAEHRVSGLSDVPDLTGEAMREDGSSISYQFVWGMRWVYTKLPLIRKAGWRDYRQVQWENGRYVEDYWKGSNSEGELYV